ncbi:hypothetical protein T4B_7588 [Trichinella pseudospiralis]|uniref:LEM domain-containing protein n=1 Tax=Trichinella pseudospiralis TaxID=6337 RepID=A0A0V1EHA6_TRIPS|nr:hypothetical protein T4E_3277 [Trichinella pseudospiralis]KRY72467.1 hypothetical protein T4A_4827 [Trichinella pseudospiralis]KRZ24550.1 hypothetical protein T4B_7588 [Trichinella pseudospiralis]KRZ31067.1 hypothetical protein T4C_1292 [Trichinella pseudospiralis]
MAKKSVKPQDDDMLLRELREYGIKSGPITDSTRELYLKKLAAVIDSMNLDVKIKKEQEEQRLIEQMNNENRMLGSETVRTFENSDPFKITPIQHYGPPPKKRLHHGLIKRRIPVVRNRESNPEPPNMKSGWNAITTGMLAVVVIVFAVFIYMLLYRVNNDT